LSIWNSSRLPLWRIPHHRGIKVKVVAHSRNLTMLYSEWEPGAVAPVHSHPNEQLGIVLKGQAEVKIGDREYRLSKGHTYCIPANSEHTERALGRKRLVFLEVFYPARKDLLMKRFGARIIKRVRAAKSK